MTEPANNLKIGNCPKCGAVVKAVGKVRRPGYCKACHAAYQRMWRVKMASDFEFYKRFYEAHSKCKAHNLTYRGKIVKCETLGKPS